MSDNGTNVIVLSNYEIYVTTCSMIHLPIIYSNDSSKVNLDERILESYKRSIKQALQTVCLPDKMFTTAICELESLLINIRTVTNISDDIHDFKCEIPNHNSILSK